MECQQAFSPWVVVVGNVETKTGVGCIHQQLANHDKRSQFIHKGFLVVGQTTTKRQIVKSNPQIDTNTQLLLLFFFFCNLTQVVIQ